MEVLATDADLLILEATFATDTDAVAHHGHMKAAEAGHLAGAREDDLIDAASRSFSGPIRLAHGRHRIEL